MARPDEFPVVANTDTTLPAAGTDNKIQPTPTIQETGWDLGQQPAAQHFNWLFHKIYKWIEYFDSIMGTNFAKASKAEAESGVNDEKWMSPLKTKQHVDARIPVDASGAQDDTDSESLMTPEATQWVFDKYGISSESLITLSPSGGVVNVDSVVERGDYLVLATSTNPMTTRPPLLPNAAAQQGLLRVRRDGNRVMQEFIAWNFADPSYEGYTARRYASYAPNPLWGDWKSSAEVEATFTDQQSLAPTGYQKLPGGVIIQWGSTMIGDDARKDITLPIEMPTTGLSVVASSARDTTVANHGQTLISASFIDNGTIRISQASVGNYGSFMVNWIAIGH